MSNTNSANYTIIQNSDIELDISHGAFRLYCLLQKLCYQKDYCFPSASYMAQKLHCSTRSIFRYLKELYAQNLVSRRRRGSTSNVYTLLKKKVNEIKTNVANTVNNIKKNSKKRTNTKSYYPSKQDNWGDYGKNPNRRPNEYYSKFENQLLGWE